MRGTNLGIAKGTGFPDSYAEFLAGHSTGAKENYIGPEKTGKLWLERCELVFCFLSDEQKIKKAEERAEKIAGAITRAVVEKMQVELDRRIGEIDKLEQSYKSEQARYEELIKKANEKPKIQVVDSTENDRITSLLGEGYEFVPNAPTNGQVYLRRRQLS